MTPRKSKSKYWGRPKNAPIHPYIEFEGTPLWKVIKKALMDFEGNQDLTLTEWHQYIVGYVCKQLSKADLVTEASTIRK